MSVPKSDFGYPPIYSGIDMSGLRDVNLLGVNDGDALVWDETTENWVPGTVAGATELDDLNDVVLTDPADTEVLAYDGNDWVNAAPTPGPLSSLTDTDITDLAANDFLRYQGSAWINVPFPTLTTSDLTDMAISGATDGQILTYNGSDWVNRSTAVLTTVTATDIIATTSITDGTLTIADGSISGVTTLTMSGNLTVAGNGNFTGLVTAGSITDGVVDLDGSGNISNVLSMLANDVLITKSTVTQITSDSTAVTINYSAGVITTYSLALTEDESTSFTVNSTYCNSDSVVLVTVANHQGNGLPAVRVGTIANGSFVITITNISDTTMNAVIKIGFVIH